MCGLKALNLAGVCLSMRTTATAMFSYRMISEYALSAFPHSFSCPGSFWIGCSFKRDCIDTRTVRKLQEVVHEGPDQVPRMDRQTLPSTYRFGLNRTRPSPVTKST